MEEINGLMPEGNVEYTEDNIRHLDDMEHIRVRSGMYRSFGRRYAKRRRYLCIAKRGNGQQHR